MDWFTNIRINSWINSWIKLTQTGQGPSFNYRWFISPNWEHEFYYLGGLHFFKFSKVFWRQNIKFGFKVYFFGSKYVQMVYRIWLEKEYSSTNHLYIKMGPEQTRLYHNSSLVYARLLIPQFCQRGKKWNSCVQLRMRPQ